jgi:hypothetical protein
MVMTEFLLSCSLTYSFSYSLARSFIHSVEVATGGRLSATQQEIKEEMDKNNKNKTSD